VLAYGGQEFEDHRVKPEQWPALKASTPTGQLPYLEVDGKPLAQSIAIARYLARQTGSAGQSAWEEAQVDALVDHVSDAGKGFYEYVVAVFSGDQDKAQQLKDKYVSSGVVPYLASLEAQLKANDGGKGYFVGSKPTWGDLAVVVLEDELVRLNGDILASYPLLKAHNTRVHELKGIKEWLAKRPEAFL